MAKHELCKELLVKMVVDAFLLVTVCTVVMYIWVASNKQMWGYQKAEVFNAVSQTEM